MRGRHITALLLVVLIAGCGDDDVSGDCQPSCENNLLTECIGGVPVSRVCEDIEDVGNFCVDPDGEAFCAMSDEPSDACALGAARGCSGDDLVACRGGYVTEVISDCRDNNARCEASEEVEFVCEVETRSLIVLQEGPGSIWVTPSFGSPQGLGSELDLELDLPLGTLVVVEAFTDETLLDWGNESCDGERLACVFRLNQDVTIDIEFGAL